jgi:hypothetical protein
MNILSMNGNLIFKDTLFYATISQLETDEIEDGVQPKIKIWFADKQRNENGPLAEILEIENNFKVWFDDHYGHSYMTLIQLGNFINWVVEEVMKNPHYMSGKITK